MSAQPGGFHFFRPQDHGDQLNFFVFLHRNLSDHRYIFRRFIKRGINPYIELSHNVET